MDELTSLELVLLRIIAEGKGKLGWYQIGVRLSRMNVPRELDMMSTLKGMIAHDLVVRHVMPGSPHDQWEVTEKGRAVLEAAEAKFRVDSLGE